MGMLGKLVTGTLLSRALRQREERQRAAREGQFIPAAEPDGARTGGRMLSNPVIGRATQFYRENPALVHALAATAGAIVLSRMRRRT